MGEGVFCVINRQGIPMFIIIQVDFNERQIDDFDDELTVEQIDAHWANAQETRLGKYGQKQYRFGDDWFAEKGID